MPWDGLAGVGGAGRICSCCAGMSGVPVASSTEETLSQPGVGWRRMAQGCWI